MPYLAPEQRKHSEGYDPLDDLCEECQKDKDYCCDCYDHSLYKSPDAPESQGVR
jgi:hypothetical protein